MNKKNIFKDLANTGSEEIFETLIKTEYFRLEKIISYCHITPKDKWYDQSHDEWVMMLKV